MEIRETVVERISSAYYGISHLNPENVRVKLDSFEAPKDVGAFAYAIREYGRRPQREYNLPIRVKQESLLKHRRPFIQNLLDEFHKGSWAEATIDDYFNRFEAIFQWFNGNGQASFLKDVENARVAYTAYSDHLRHGVKIDAKGEGHSPSYAFRHQIHCRKLISIAFPDDHKYIVTAATTIKKPKSTTEVPTHRRIIQLADSCTTAFQQISKAVLGNLPYPWRLRHVNWDYHVFPSTVAFETPFSTKTSPKKSHLFDYERGNVRSMEEYLREGCSQKFDKAQYKGAIAHFQSANSSPYNPSRFRMAQVAQRCYLMLFAINTGANVTTICEIPWDDQYELIKDTFKNGFGSVKLRARGKRVSYQLGRRGLTLFRLYVKLRYYLLNGQECDYLFFGKQNSSSKPMKLAPKFINRFYDFARGKLIPEDFVTLDTRDFRLYKEHGHYTDGAHPDDVAGIMQHSPETSQRIYAKGTEESQSHDFSAFWSSVNAVRIIYQESLSSSENTNVSIPSGHCTNYNHPDPIIADPPITPACDEGQGCLFCKNYVCHADKADIEKLLSLLYVISRVRDCFPDYEKADQVFRALAVRIRSVIKQMKQMSSEIEALVGRMEAQVLEHGVLSSFWEMKLSRYESMGLVQ